MSQPIHLSYLNGPDVDALAMTDDEILSAVEGALAAQGRGETVIEPRVHLVPDPEAGKLTERTLHAELAEILAGKKPGRERDDETILILAPRPRHHRHRPRPRHAREGCPPRRRPAPPLRLTGSPPTA